MNWHDDHNYARAHDAVCEIETRRTAAATALKESEAAHASAVAHARAVESGAADGSLAEARAASVTAEERVVAARRDVKLLDAAHEKVCAARTVVESEARKVARDIAQRQVDEELVPRAVKALEALAAVEVKIQDATRRYLAASKHDAHLSGLIGAEKWAVIRDLGHRARVFVGKV